MTKKTKDTIINHSILATLTATSNKQSEDFIQDVPTKTAYWRVEDPTSLAKLKELGIVEYGEDEKFFIIKMAQNLKIYTPFSMSPVETIKMTVKDKDGEDIPNYTTDEEEVRINFVEGEYLRRKFFRVNAILSHGNPLVKLEAENPFTEFLQLEDVNDDVPF